MKTVSKELQGFARKILETPTTVVDD